MFNPTNMARLVGTMGIGHFFLALNPALFRETDDFRADVISFTDALRATKPADPTDPVMVAGDPERRNAARRLQSGIPIGPGLLTQLRTLAGTTSAPWLLG